MITSGRELIQTMNNPNDSELVQLELPLDPDNVLGCDPGTMVKFTLDQYTCPKCRTTTKVGIFKALALDEYYVDSEGILYRLYLPEDLKADCNCARGFLLTSVIPVYWSSLQELDAEERRELRGDVGFLNA